MKFLTTLTMMILSTNSFSASITFNDRPKVLEVHCEAKSNTGSTKFDFHQGEGESTSVTNSLYITGVNDYYNIPSFAVLSKTGNREPLEYGNSIVTFIIKANSPSSNRFFAYQFVLKENATYGSKVYEATLLGTNVGGYPFPGKTLYTYIGVGSCEVNLEKR